MNLINEQRRAEEGIEETRLVRGKETANEPNADSDNSQPLGCDFQSSEYEQVRSYRSTGQGENAEVTTTIGGEDPGKIRERLKLVEKAFLSYVHNHQERLEARLDESRTLEENFLTAVRELERDIDSLTSTQEELDNSDVENNDFP